MPFFCEANEGVQITGFCKVPITNTSACEAAVERLALATSVWSVDFYMSDYRPYGCVLADDGRVYFNSRNSGDPCSVNEQCVCQVCEFCDKCQLGWYSIDYGHTCLDCQRQYDRYIRRFRYTMPDIPFIVMIVFIVPYLWFLYALENGTVNKATAAAFHIFISHMIALGSSLPVLTFGSIPESTLTVPTQYFMWNWANTYRGLHCSYSWYVMWDEFFCELNRILYLVFLSTTMINSYFALDVDWFRSCEKGGGICKGYMGIFLWPLYLIPIALYAPFHVLSFLVGGWCGLRTTEENRKKRNAVFSYYIYFWVTLFYPLNWVVLGVFATDVR